MEREIFRADGSLVVITVHGWDMEGDLDHEAVDEQGDWTCLTDSEYRQLVSWYTKETEE